MVLGLLALTSGYALAQDTVWTRRFDIGIPGWTDESGGATIDPFGDLIAVDALWNEEALESTYSYYVMVKYSPTGDTAWTRTRFCDSAAVVAGGIAADGVGNLAVVGSFEPLDDYRVAGEVALYDGNGDSLWTRHIRIDDLTFLGAVVIDNSQNILVAGSNSDISRGTKDALLAKYSPGGELSWSRTLDFGRDTLEQLSGLCLDSDSGVVAVGISGYRGGRSVVARFSAAGDTVWTRQLDLDPEPAGHEFLNAVDRDPDGNFVACGAAWPGSGGAQRAVVVKFTPAGDTVWTSTFESEFDAWAFDVAVDSAGNALVAGSLADSTGRRLGLLVKYSPDGEQVWSGTYRLDSDNWCSSVDLSGPNTVYVTGTVVDSVPENWDLFAMRLDYAPAIAEHAPTRVERMRGPTVMRAADLARITGRIFDATGRRVTGQAIRPGVYHVASETGVAVRRVIATSR